MSRQPRGAQTPQDQERVRTSYDAVADAYVARVHDELAHKPLDRGLLTAFAEQLQEEHGAGATACDMGCGPGHVAHFSRMAGLSSPASTYRRRWWTAPEACIRR